ncbi:C-GCAxxG-C-C family protein [Eubacteriaceae bacterium ES3]|nr:C-GCAxxG-C-C family protein [Eubacteriaceae bacterium ES3]
MDELEFDLFRLASKGYCCSQIIMKMALDLEGLENQDLIRAMGGLCNGIGGSQKTCGVLTGAIAVFGLYAGKGADGEYEKPGYNRMVQEFMEWFEAENGSTECIDLIGLTQFESAGATYPVKCGELIKEGYVKMLELLEENGYEPGERE